MTITAKGIAAAVAGLVSLSVVGVALANEPDDPIVEESVEEVATCPDPGMDEGTTDEGTTDEGTDEGATDEGTTDEGAPDEGATDEGTTDDPDDGCESTDGPDGGGTDGSTDDGIDELEQSSEEVDSDEVEALVEDGERPQNHGWYVSEATKTCPESGPERGECISAVAKSDVGKPHADAGEAAAEDEGETSVEGTGDTGDQSPAKAAKGSKGGGKAKGRGGKG